MAFHLTTGSLNTHRSGTFHTLAEAMASGMLRVATGADSPAYIVEAPTGAMSGGRLVAGYDDELGWIELNADEPAPEWWDKLDERAQQWVLNGPRRDLPSWMVEAATKAGAGALSVYWVSSSNGAAPFQLTQAAQDWASRRRLIELF